MVCESAVQVKFISIKCLHEIAAVQTIYCDGAAGAGVFSGGVWLTAGAAGAAFAAGLAAAGLWSAGAGLAAGGAGFFGTGTAAASVFTLVETSFLAARLAVKTQPC